MNHAIRITLPYDACKDVISRWADRCNAVVVYEHEADEEVSKTHVHIALYGCEVKAEQLKRMWHEPPGKGNEFWSFKEATGIPSVYRYTENVGNTELDISELKYIAYMTKGNLAPSFLKYISAPIVEKARQSWVEPVKADKPGDHSERVIREILEQFKNEKFKTTYSLNDMEDEGLPINVIHTRVRKAVFRKLWGEHRRVPHASFFKIVADSAFLRICERLDRFEEGMSAVLNIES